MAFAPYCTENELKSWTSIDDSIDDVEITLAVNTASRWIDKFCQRNFWQDGTVGVPVARTFQNNGSAWCKQFEFGPYHDLTNAVVPVVATDSAGDGTFETTWAATDYQLQPWSRPNGEPYTKIVATGALMFPPATQTGRWDRISITGVWGWSAVPDTVQQAALIQAARLLGRRRSPEGVIGGTVGDFTAMRVSSRLDPDVEQLLMDYKHPTTAVLVA